MTTFWIFCKKKLSRLAFCLKPSRTIDCSDSLYFYPSHIRKTEHWNIARSIAMIQRRRINSVEVLITTVVWTIFRRTCTHRKPVKLITLSTLTKTLTADTIFQNSQVDFSIFCKTFTVGRCTIYFINAQVNLHQNIAPDILHAVFKLGSPVYGLR